MLFINICLNLQYNIRPDVCGQVAVRVERGANVLNLLDQKRTMGNTQMPQALMGGCVLCTLYH